MNPNLYCNNSNSNCKSKQKISNECLMNRCVKNTIVPIKKNTAVLGDGPAACLNRMAAVRQRLLASHSARSKGAMPIRQGPGSLIRLFQNSNLHPPKVVNWITLWSAQ